MSKKQQKPQQQVETEINAQVEQQGLERNAAFSLKIEGDLRGIPHEILKQMYARVPHQLWQHRGYFTAEIPGMTPVEIKELKQSLEQNVVEPTGVEQEQPVKPEDKKT
ncbi:MAG: hypothetical protein EZS28_007243 [Streblomastix strix]|uniref:Uncharacterized protein n=1 Tax=Streblomastix strix TaxID=222440 RepID=A0A5J4WR26_9EUKA|nr:MAG: hypothetical protein EZS28_007243 [Streblomastix strix]